MADDEPKIIIDEGWKAQVQRERDTAPEEPAEQPDQAEQSAQADQPEQTQDMPEASFASLMGSLATQAMLALGVIAPEGQDKMYLDLVQAKYCIDTLAMLREKTDGNLSDEESGELTQAVAELQQLYVARAQQMQETEMREAGVDPMNLTGEPS